MKWGLMKLPKLISTLISAYCYCDAAKYLWAQQPLGCGNSFFIIKSWFSHKVSNYRCPSSSPSITPPVGPRSHPHFLACDHLSRWSYYMTNAFMRPTLWVEGVSPQKSHLHIPLYPYCAMFHTSRGNLLLPYPGGSSGLLWQGHPHFSHASLPVPPVLLLLGLARCSAISQSLWVVGGSSPHLVTLGVHKQPCKHIYV